ncbi:hypothetical protein [Rhodococcus sp. NPDC127528]|uniref:hypothetical protein n=1 Tax=unclassified Rhodococcus (in: high G+C Gram-positive bacteria) TaxID=192944 RepID=UPI0036349D80
MRTAARHTARVAATTALGAAAILAGTGVAAADEWPTPPPYPTPLVPYETTSFLTPTDLDYWNPFVSADRLTSPYGTSTRIVCEGFHGVTLDCWQADRQGRPHKLVKLAMDYPGSLGSALPGGGAGHFVYPVWDTGS